MNSRYTFFFLVFFIFSPYKAMVFAQEKTNILPNVVIEEFIQNIGGEKWRSLTSRKEYADVLNEQDKNAIIPIKNYERIKINTQPGRMLEVHKYSNRNTILSYNPGCNWFYSTNSQVVKFFGPEPIKHNNTFPRTELMEVLNLQPMKRVYVEDTLYRIDFEDARQIDGKQSLFFGIESGLLYLRKYTSKNEVCWEFRFSDYKESDGFFEPYRVKLTSNEKDFLDITIQSIEYDAEVNLQAFEPPIPCENKDYFERLEFPYLLDLE